MSYIENKIIQTRYFKYLLAAACGMLTALPMIVPQLFFVSWISLILFFYSLFIIKKKFKTYFFMFFTYGFFYFLIIYTWFLSLHPLDWAGLTEGRSLLVVLTLWLSISVAQGLEYSFMGLFYAAANPKGIHKILTISFVWVIVEWLVGLSIWGMPWGRLAAGQSWFLPFIQSGSLFGSLFVGFLVVGVNALAAFAIMNRRNKKIWQITAAVAAGILVCNSLFGVIRIAVVENSHSGQSVKVAVIQGNLPSDEKWQNEGRNAFNVFYSLSENAAQMGVKIIVWPESAVPVPYSKGENLDETYKEFADLHDVYLVIGGFLVDEEDTYSILALYTPDGESGIENAYKKRQLVPFGEYVPYRDFLYSVLPFVTDFTMLEDDLTPGSETVLFDTEYGKISGLICFDSIFPQFSYEDARAGSELIVMGTNDSFYGNSLNPRQHNSHAVLRAAENGRYIARAANTGISCIISPTGRITESSKMNEEIIIMSDVYFRNTKTLYTLTGDIIVLIAFVYVISAAVYFNASRLKYYNNQ